MIQSAYKNTQNEFVLFGNERFLVELTSSATGVTQPIIWDARKPIDFLNFHLSLDLNSNSIVLEDKHQTNSTTKISVFDISSERTEALNSIQANSLYQIALRRIPAMRAPYISTTSSNTVGDLYISSGVKKYLIQYSRSQKGRFIGYVRKSPAFTIEKKDHNYRVSALLDGVTVSGKDSLLLKAGEAIEVATQEIQNISIHRAFHWWRFNCVANPLIQDSEYTKVTFNSEWIREESSEKSWFKNTAILIASLGAAAFLLLTQSSNTNTKVVIKPEPKELSISIKKAKLIKKFAAAPPPLPVIEKPVVIKNAQPKKEKTPEIAKPKINKGFMRSKTLLTSALGNLTAGVASKTVIHSQNNSLVDTSSNSPSPPVNDNNLDLLSRESSLSGIAEKVDTGPVDSQSIKESMGSGLSDVGDENATFTEEGLTKDEIGRVVHSHISEVRYCYESATLRSSSIAGKILVSFSVNPAGSVVSSRVISNDTGEVSLASCVVGRLKSWAFPKPRGGKMVTVSYPFSFKKIGMGGS